MRVAVVVLGDVGRSPRMQYHAMSLAALPNTSVHIIGYQGAPCWPSLENAPNVHFMWMNASPSVLVLKILHQTLLLFWLLMTMPRPDYILCQTPPAIPLLLVARVVCWWRRARLVIDCHNYGWTLLNLERKGGLLVWLYRLYEGAFLRGGAYATLCVSKAMKEDLKIKESTVLYDRPPDFFRRATREEALALMQRTGYGGDGPLIVSATSWTRDEDFGLLLRALRLLDERVAGMKSFPRLRLVITGRGEQRAHFEQLLREAPLKQTTVHTGFLSSSDYVTLLGAADLGICLHTSSSGVDLPMKVVDMFGCQLPVCAANYRAIHELIDHDGNSLLFNDAEDLAGQLFDLFENYPDMPLLDYFREQLKTFQSHRWEDEWRERAQPIFH